MVTAMAMLLLRAALRYPVSPGRCLAALHRAGALLPFVFLGALSISLLAGLRAELMGASGPFRFGTSLFGFVLLPSLLLAAGRLFGGRGSWSAVAAAVVGAGLPFILVDGAWAVWLAAGAAAGQGALIAFERLSWLWALWLLVLGLAAALRISRLRALGAVGVVAVGAVLLVAGLIRLRAAGM